MAQGGAAAGAHTALTNADERQGRQNVEERRDALMATVGRTFRTTHGQFGPAMAFWGAFASTLPSTRIELQRVTECDTWTGAGHQKPCAATLAGSMTTTATLQADNLFKNRLDKPLEDATVEEFLDAYWATWTKGECKVCHGNRTVRFTVPTDLPPLLAIEGLTWSRTLMTSDVISFRHYGPPPESQRRVMKYQLRAMVLGDNTHFKAAHFSLNEQLKPIVRTWDGLQYGGKVQTMSPETFAQRMDDGKEASFKLTMILLSRVA